MDVYSRDWKKKKKKKIYPPKYRQMIIKYKHTNIYTEIYTKCSFLIFQKLILTSDF